MCRSHTNNIRLASATMWGLNEEAGGLRAGYTRCGGLRESDLVDCSDDRGQKGQKTRQLHARRTGTHTQSA